MMLKAFLLALLLLAVFFGVFYYEHLLWVECRATPHTWWYCYRTLSR